MGVIFQTGYSLPGGAQPLTHARIAHAYNWLTGGTVTASGTAAGFFADAPLSPLTYERWKPDALPGIWEYDHGSAAAVDYCLIAGHTMGTNGNTLQIQYWNGSGWTGVIPSTALADDSPVFAMFGPQTRQRWRIVVSGGTAPEIAVIRFGVALQMQRPIWQGVAPSLGQRETTVIGNVSESGEFLSRRIVRRRRSASYRWQHLEQAWVRSNLYGATGLIRALEREPFACAWRPGSVTDVDFGWVPGRVDAPSITQIDLMDFGFSAEVYSDG